MEHSINGLRKEEPYRMVKKIMKHSLVRALEQQEMITLSQKIHQELRHGNKLTVLLPLTIIWTPDLLVSKQKVALQTQ